ncbi:hypothetical protein KIPB_007571, partial [Kipferlia bialata]|eukprot:g7571.t1
MSESENEEGGDVPMYLSISGEVVKGADEVDDVQKEKKGKGKGKGKGKAVERRPGQCLPVGTIPESGIPTT